MHFHFCARNCAPQSRGTLLDMFHWLRAGLEELGQEVTFSDEAILPSAMNVLWEGFTPATGEELRRSRARYGIIVTEFMDGSGFNKGTPQSDRNDRRDDAYRERWLGFEAAARGARFFWSMVESNVAPLRERSPASYVELGFSDRLVPRVCEEPSIDFSFTGILTPRRSRILEALEKRASVVWHKNLLPVEQRDKLFFATRINLSISKTADWQMPSGTRVGLALLGKRGIALDWTPQQTRQSSLVGSCPEAVDYVDFALRQLNSDWGSAAEVAFERYRAELPMRGIMERALDESLASRSGLAVQPILARSDGVARFVPLKRIVATAKRFLPIGR